MGQKNRTSGGGGHCPNLRIFVKMLKEMLGVT